jgi:predicted HicB family RNase H-like nuclease
VAYSRLSPQERVISSPESGIPWSYIEHWEKSNAMTYKGYDASVKFDEAAAIFHGEVINTRDVITFQGTSVRELQKAFHDSVEESLRFCAERGEQPDKPYSGKFVVRVSPGLHREIAVRAGREGLSLNAFVQQALEAEGRGKLKD